MTLVSVIIPTYNRTDVLCGRALASVLRQPHQDLDIHIVADGMEGEELDRLRSVLEGLHDRRIRMTNIPRQSYPDDPGQRWCVLGLDARNHGLDMAFGEWIAPLDDDDEWTDDHLDTLLEAVKESDFAYGMSRYHWSGGGDSQLAGRWPPGMGSFCDGAQLYRNGMGFRYDPACIERGLPEDGDLWTRMYESQRVRFVFVPKIVHHYYPNPR